MNRSVLSRVLSLLSASLALVACGGGGTGTGSGNPGPITDCSATAQKQYVLASTREWYLFPELLPPTVDIASFATATDLLNSLTATARAQSRDRFFSGITSISAEQAVLSGGESAGIGLSLLTLANPSRVVISQVFESSAAADAGLARGDVLLAIGTSLATLEPIDVILARPNGLNDAIGPATVGLVRALRWRNLVGVVTEREVTKRVFSLNAVPGSGVRLIARGGGLPPVGHLTLRSFISPADSALRSAFDTFRTQGVRDVIIDLRYNGGGLVSSAELLLNLLGGTRTNEISYQTRLNANKSANQETIRFQQQPQTIASLRVAFITTDLSASASELVINSMVPHVPTAVIGARSFGKPVGQFAFDIASCDFRMRLVTFKTVNKNGNGDYYTGLPDAGFLGAGGAACAAPDDFSRLPGDSSEAMTAEALFWINNNRCSGASILDAGAGSSAKAAADLAAKQAAQAPSPVSALQYYLPGTY
jgi:C-terminal processing protease CtpA/Prc